MQITTIGLDIAKNVFQVHGIDANETAVVRKQLRRSQVLAFFKALPPCLIGMEACATAHYWARELTKLGHRVRLMPAKDVKAYVKRNKNDAADAEAICEAVRRPTMRFVRIKSAEQQGQLMQHRTRDLLMRQIHRNFAVRVSALEKFSGRDRNGFDVTIGARLAVNEDFKLRARWICQLHRPQSSSASRLTAGACGFLNFSQSGERPDR